MTKDDKNYFIHNRNDKKGFKISPEDTVVIVRGSVGRFDASLDLLSQLEKANFFVINNRETIEVCGDKFRTTLKLTENNIPTPKARIIRDIESVDEICSDFDNKFPLVLKTIKGSKGVGVLMVKSYSDLVSVLQLVWKTDPDVEMLLQEYVKSDFDYRIHVLNNEVIGGMKRIRKTKDFRTNYSLGNDVENVPVDEMSDELKEIAIKSTKAVGGI